MASKSSEDFWNKSSFAAFNFDDDDEDEPLDQEYGFPSISEATSILPIHSLISNRSLDLILGDLTTTNKYVVPPVEEAIRKMLTGQKYCLEVYKKFTDKLSLLDSAIESMDGNIILKVILFLKSTLTQNIFFHQLSKRKIAVRHYANHLTVNNQYTQLADLYMATGQDVNMKQLYYLVGRDIKNKASLYKRLETFTTEHLQKVSNNNDKLEINENMQFLQWQIEHNENCDTVIEQLAVVCKKQWEKNKNSNEEIFEFKKKMKINDFAFEWTAMNVLASMKLWSQLNELFMKPNWLTKKNTLKIAMSAEIFVYGLSRHNPPQDVLEHYLPFISDYERSLVIAQRMDCHKYVIKYYIKDRDRLALIHYKSKVSPQTEEYFLIENALLSSDKKWKN